MENLHLVAGLGNPGTRYRWTRHNAGFLVVERLAQRWRSSWSLEAKFEAELTRAERAGRKVMLCRPLTYMNRSGEAVGAVQSYFQTTLDHLLVVVDEADLPFGALRLRPKGSSAGHHGLESVERHLGSREFARLRVGIGRQAPEQRAITEYVLSRFDPEEMPALEAVLDRAADQVECWLTEGIETAMNRFNRRIEPTGTEDS